MAALAPKAPTLQFDTEELKRWGYIWRIGTKARAAKRADEEEEEDESDEAGGEPGQDLEAESAEIFNEGLVAVAAPAVATAAAPATAKTKSKSSKSAHVLSAADAGLPSELSDIVDEAKKYASAFSKKQGMDFGLVFDRAVGQAFAKMLGNIPVVEFKGSSKAGALQPPQPDCIEVGPARIIGGVRPQNFDVAYRPDGVRIAYDSKSLNDQSSIQKNWQNMVNDLATEATTVHTRFPYAIVGFIVALPRPALKNSQELDMIRTLERMATREHVIDQPHLAEAIALVVWDPETGEIDPNTPHPDSHLRHEKFMEKVFHCYSDRYKGLPPHDK